MTVTNLKLGKRTYVLLPEHALTDGTQSITPKTLEDMMATPQKNRGFRRLRNLKQALPFFA